MLPFVFIRRHVRSQRGASSAQPTVIRRCACRSSPASLPCSCWRPWPGVVLAAGRHQYGSTVRGLLEGTAAAHRMGTPRCCAMRGRTSISIVTPTVEPRRLERGGGVAAAVCAGSARSRRVCAVCGEKAASRRRSERWVPNPGGRLRSCRQGQGSDTGTALRSGLAAPCDEITGAVHQAGTLGEELVGGGVSGAEGCGRVGARVLARRTLSPSLPSASAEQDWRSRGKGLGSSSWTCAETSPISWRRSRSVSASSVYACSRCLRSSSTGCGLRSLGRRLRLRLRCVRGRRVEVLLFSHRVTDQFVGDLVDEVALLPATGHRPHPAEHLLDLAVIGHEFSITFPPCVSVSASR